MGPASLGKETTRVMLCIKGDSGRWGSWHVGETLRVPKGRVITFQADGDELEEILEMFKASNVGVLRGLLDHELTPVL